MIPNPNRRLSNRDALKLAIENVDGDARRSMNLDRSHSVQKSEVIPELDVVLGENDQDKDKNINLNDTEVSSQADEEV